MSIRSIERVDVRALPHQNAFAHCGLCMRILVRSPEAAESAVLF
jgi:hypothetical protein